MEAKILATGSGLPVNKVHNDELPKELDTSHEWIVSHTGISYRHIANDEETTSTLACKAAQKAMTAAGVKPEDIGHIVVATCTPDFHSMPNTACLVQECIGAVNSSAVDISAACSGFVYGIEMLAGMLKIRNDKRPALLIGSETMSRIVDWNDRNTCVLFGDGAGAVVMQLSDDDTSGVVDSYLRAIGSGAAHLACGGGCRLPYEQVTQESPYMTMNGKAVFNFAVKAICEVITTLMERNNLSEKDIAVIVPHQANYRIIKAACKRLDFTEDDFFLNISDNANTSGASIPLALDEMNEKGLLERGKYIITVGFGAGLTYGGNLIRW